MHVCWEMGHLDFVVFTFLKLSNALQKTQNLHWWISAYVDKVSKMCFSTGEYILKDFRNAQSA